MQLHQRGLNLLVNVLDPSDHVELLTHDQMRQLLTEVAKVMSQISERDALIALNGARSAVRPGTAREAPTTHKA